VKLVLNLVKYFEINIFFGLFIFMYFMGRAIHEFKIPSKYLFTLVILNITLKSMNSSVHEQVQSPMSFNHEIVLLTYTFIPYIPYIVFIHRLTVHNVHHYFTDWYTMCIWWYVFRCTLTTTSRTRSRLPTSWRFPTGRGLMAPTGQPATTECSHGDVLVTQTF